jgi:sarcosine oxidase/L-pipecolate oxidase
LCSILSCRYIHTILTSISALPAPMPPSPVKIPSSILIIGSGVFGLATADALCQRPEYNDTKIVVIDRLPFPAPDGASVCMDCIRVSDNNYMLCSYH